MAITRFSAINRKNAEGYNPNYQRHHLIPLQAASVTDSIKPLNRIWRIVLTLMILTGMGSCYPLTNKLPLKPGIRCTGGPILAIMNWLLTGCFALSALARASLAGVIVVNFSASGSACCNRRCGRPFSAAAWRSSALIRETLVLHPMPSGIWMPVLIRSMRRPNGHRSKAEMISSEDFQTSAGHLLRHVCYQLRVPDAASSQERCHEHLKSPQYYVPSH